MSSLQGRQRATPDGRDLIPPEGARSPIAVDTGHRAPELRYFPRSFFFRFFLSLRRARPDVSPNALRTQSPGGSGGEIRKANAMTRNVTDGVSRPGDNRDKVDRVKNDVG